MKYPLWHTSTLQIGTQQEERQHTTHRQTGANEAHITGKQQQILQHTTDRKTTVETVAHCKQEKTEGTVTHNRQEYNNRNYSTLLTEKQKNKL